ncbi:MAG: ComF family protein, partial [bacterium]|nr:ComF family protein [bacterium]
MQILQGILSPITELGKSIIDVIYPGLCGFCGKYMEGIDVLYCRKCKEQIPRNYLSTVAAVKQKLHKKQYYSYIAWSFGYNEIMRKLIHDFKFNSYPILDKFIAYEMLETLLSKDELQTADCVIPVPLHRSRYRIRGYNQSKLLAELISEESEIPLNNDLKRIRNTRPQSWLDDKADKIRNVKGAFSVSEKNTLKGKNTILVDDIVTSGATINECAKELKKAGVENVFV